MLHCSLDMAHNGFNYYFSFWAIFCPFTPLTAQKSKFWKKWKKSLEISSFYICVPKIMIYGFWDMLCDRQMDGQKKWHIEVGAPPKNNFSKHLIKNEITLYIEHRNRAFLCKFKQLTPVLLNFQIIILHIALQFPQRCTE